MTKKKRNKGLQISKLEYALMLPGIARQLNKVGKDGTITVEEALISVGWLMNRFRKAASKKYKPIFGSLTRTIDSAAILINKEDKMAKDFELGISMSEILAMLPTILGEAWGHYSDDKKLTVDEALDLVSVILEQMSNAADDEDVQELFLAVRGTLLAIVPFVVEEEEPVE